MFFCATEGTLFLIGDQAKEIRELIAAMIEGQAEVGEDARRKLQPFFDKYADKLGLDSIRLVELMMELEENFDH